MNKYIYMPIESKTRELDAKIFLALEAARRGYISIIGTKDLNVYLKYIPLPKGIFLYKDSINIMEKPFKAIQKKGHKVVVHDEEGFVQFSWKDYLDSRIKFKTLKYVDVFLCWGKGQYAAIKSVSVDINPKLSLAVTGHPRIDLLRQPVCNYNNFETNTEKIILINMKFAPVNYGNPDISYIDKQLQDKPSMSDTEKEKLMELVAYKRKLLEYYNKLIKKIILKFPNNDVVIRPHPIENVNYWKSMYGSYSNVLISNEHSVGYWIHKAGVIVHTGCTTAIEGFLLDVPSIAYHPFSDEKFEIKLPDSVSVRVSSEKDCLDKIELMLSNEFNNDSYKQKRTGMLSKAISNLHGDFSVKLIINSIDKFNLPKNGFFSNLIIKSSFEFAGILFKLKKRYSKQITARVVDNSISLFYVKNVVDRFKYSTNDSEEYCIKKISNNIISISKK